MHIIITNNHNIQQNDCRLFWAQTTHTFLILGILFERLLFYFLIVCSRQLTEAGSSGAPGSHSKSLDHSHYRPYQGGGGDSGDALSVTSVSSSGSDLEDVNASFLSDSPEGHERKVRRKDARKDSPQKSTKILVFYTKCKNILLIYVTVWSKSG